MKRMARVRVSGSFDIRRILDFVRAARLYQSHIMLAADNHVTNGKGVLGLIPFFQQCNREKTFLLITDGPDSDQAYEHLVTFFDPLEYVSEEKPISLFLD